MNRGAAAHDAAQAAENALFGLRIDARKRVVEDQDARIADDRAGQSGALFLAAGKRDTALADHGVVLRGEFLHVAVEAGDFGGFADAIEIASGHSEGDVFADGFAEEIGVLRHVADGAAQGCRGAIREWSGRR